MAPVSYGVWWVQEEGEGVGALFDSSLPSGIFEDGSLASASSTWVSNRTPTKKGLLLTSMFPGGKCLLHL